MTLKKPTEIQAGKNIDFDNHSIKEIKEMIKNNIIAEQDVIDYYNNQWWDYEPE